jgi:hypothetical protein
MRIGYNCSRDVAVDLKDESQLAGLENIEARARNV